MNWPRIKQNLLFGTVIITFVGVIAWGVNNGIKAAGSKSVIHNAETITTAVGYFYEDQDRYPTGLEFADNNLMAAYLSNLPARDFISGTCSQSYNYANPFPRQFQLDVCLSKSTDGMTTGWNTYSKSK